MTSLGMLGIPYEKNVGSPRFVHEVEEVDGDSDSHEDQSALI